MWLLLAIFMAGALASCSSTKGLAENEHLLVKNQVKLPPCKVSAADLQSIIKQRPNKRFLWILPRIKLHLHNLAHERDSRFWHWIRENLGESPTVLDTVLVRITREQMEEFLFQEGYFNSRVVTEIEYLPRKRLVRNKARVLYMAEPGAPYYIDTIIRTASDPTMQYLLEQDVENSALQQGKRYRYADMEAERKAVLERVHEFGYFDFNKSYIRFTVDSALGDHRVRLTERIVNPETGQHRQYFLNNTYVYPNFDFFGTTDYTDTIRQGRLNIVYHDKLRVNPDLLWQSVYLDDPLYKGSKVQRTYRRLSELNVYSHISVEMNKVPGSDSLLNGFVYLTPAKRHSFTIESRLETRANTGNEGSQVNDAFNLGISGSLTLSRRNAFRNGELLKIGLTGGVEPFFLSDSTFSQKFFNTVQFGPTVEIIFPRFLLPVQQSKFAKRQRPETRIGVNFNLLRNEDLERKSVNGAISYRWSESQEKRHIVTPLEVSVVNADLSSRLEARLADLGDPFLANSYRDQIILSSSYTFIYRPSSRTRWSWSYRGKAESAGSTVRLLAPAVLGKPNANGAYEIVEIPFAHYLLQDNDLRLYRQGNEDRAWAFRLFAGVGKPLKNLQTLPFEKSFFAGGANGIRAWRARTLGPGSHLDTTFSSGIINQIGELRLELNAEYRFPIIGFLEGALFTDIGNIWMVSERSDRPGAEISSRFHKELAVGSGLGIRLDFDFFIIRFDAGLQVRDPALPDGERWFFQPKKEYNGIVDRYNARNAGENFTPIGHYRPEVNFNVGIGYPF